MEYNILGCNVRVSTDEENNKTALEALDILRDEISSVKMSNPSLSDLDAVVLSALRITSRKINMENDLRDDLFSLRSDVKEVISMVDASENTDAAPLN